MAAFDSFVNFVNQEIVKRISTNDGPTSWVADRILVATGVGLGTTVKTLAQLGIVSQATLDAYALTVTAAIASSETSAKAYADGLVVGLWDDRGGYDASGGAYPITGGSGTAGAVLKGDIWTISVAGTLPMGQVVEAGDTVRALINTPGQTQANWAIQQNNIGYVPFNVANVDTDGTLAANSDSKVASQKATRTYVTTAIAAATEFLTSTFRIKDVTDATKQLAFEVSGIATGTTRTITAPNRNLDLATFSYIEYLRTGTKVIEANVHAAEYRIANTGVTLDITTLGGSSAPFTLSNWIGWLGGTIGSSVNVTLVHTGSSFDIVDVSGTTIGSIGPGSPLVVTLQPYETWKFQLYSFYQYCVIKSHDPPLLINRMKFRNSVTSGLGWTFSGTATANRVITLANKDINLGDLSAVATTNGNVLSGTRTRIIGGTNNTVSGTDNIVAGVTGATVNGTRVAVIGGELTGQTLSGTDQVHLNAVSSFSSVITQTHVTAIASYAGVILTDTILQCSSVGATAKDITTDGAAAGATNRIPCSPSSGSVSSVGSTHEVVLEMVSTSGTAAGVAGKIVRKYLVSFLGGTVGSQQVGTDLIVGTITNTTVNVTFTAASSGTLLNIAVQWPTTDTGKTLYVTAYVRSVYNIQYS